MKVQRAVRTTITTVVTAVAAVALAILGFSMVAASETPVAELTVPTFGGGGGTSESTDGAVAVESLLGQPDVEVSEGGGVALVPGAIGASVTVTDACPGVEGPLKYEGCPSAVTTSLSLKITDQRSRPTACGNGQPTCTVIESAAPLKLYDRTKFVGLTIALRTGGSVRLTKNPDAALYDDIFESSAANAAAAANYACTTDAAGRCTAGVRAAGDLLLLARFPDGSKTIYVGRTLSALNFVDTDGDTRVDLATEAVRGLSVAHPSAMSTRSPAETHSLT